jgi:hypothetical protein
MRPPLEAQAESSASPAQPADSRRDCFKSRSGESYGGDLRAPERSDLEVVSTVAQKIAARRPPERLLKQSRSARRERPGITMKPECGLLRSQLKPPAIYAIALQYFAQSWLKQGTVTH